MLALFGTDNLGIEGKYDVKTGGCLTQLREQKQIGQIMRQPALTVSPLMAAEQAPAIVHENKIGCLPVVEGERLVGILTESGSTRSGD